MHSPQFRADVYRRLRNISSTLLERKRTQSQRNYSTVQLAAVTAVSMRFCLNAILLQNRLVIELKVLVWPCFDLSLKLINPLSDNWRSSEFMNIQKIHSNSILNFQTAHIHLCILILDFDAELWNKFSNFPFFNLFVHFDATNNDVQIYCFWNYVHGFRAMCATIFVIECLKHSHPIWSEYLGIYNLNMNSCGIRQCPRRWIC